MHANLKVLNIFLILFMLVLPSPFEAAQGEGIPSVEDYYKNKEKGMGNQTDISGDTNGVTDNRTPGVTVWDFIKMIFALLFVVILIYGALRFINKRNKWFDNGRLVENIGGASLGNNKSLQLVKIGNSILVVGVGDSINLLKEITDEEESEALLKAYKERTEEVPFSSESFVGIMKKLPMSKKKENTRGFSSLLKDQLGQLSKERKEKINELRGKGRV